MRNIFFHRIPFPRQPGYDRREISVAESVSFGIPRYGRRSLKQPKVVVDMVPHYVYNVDIVAELLGAFEQAVLLAVWNLAEEAYGRAVLRGAQSALDRQVAAGAVYATLDRLEQKSLIASRLEEGTPVRAGRVRRYYRLTAAGIKALNESKAALEQVWRGAKWPLESKA